MNVQFNPRKIWRPATTKSTKYATRQERSGFVLAFTRFIPKKFSFDRSLSTKSNRRSNRSITSSRMKSAVSADHKVFKPNQSALAKEAIKQAVTTKRSKKNNFKFGVKKISHLQSKIQDFTLKKLLRNIRYHIYKWKIFQHFNRFMALVMTGFLALFIVYTTWFDSYFMIKTYNVTYAQGSYLDKEDTSKLIQSIKKNKFLGFIPNNQYWFLNKDTLTFAAQKDNPEIVSIELNERIWPNQTNLKIHTEPILLTLSLNNGEFWRVGEDGTVLSKDDAGVYEYLVSVERPVVFNRSNVSLKDYSFKDNSEQLNRFWFVRWLWSELNIRGITPVRTVLPSLFDSDVIIETSSGSRLLFDVNSRPKETQLKRIEAVLDSLMRTKINSGEIVYIDFRAAKRVFLCSKGAPCEKN